MRSKPRIPMRVQYPYLYSTEFLRQRLTMLDERAAAAAGHHTGFGPLRAPPLEYPLRGDARDRQGNAGRAG